MLALGVGLSPEDELQARAARTEACSGPDGPSFAVDDAEEADDGQRPFVLGGLASGLYDLCYRLPGRGWTAAGVLDVLGPDPLDATCSVGACAVAVEGRLGTSSQVLFAPDCELGKKRAPEDLPVPPPPQSGGNKSNSA